ncbi:uncharacterized protein B0H18DRAFT_957782 [Fomitopsis serialis]|uniref:uncharacterized protein n=1 Tax=Fomitopsis serialis TaxID=139415 RepID=UPI002008B897|nr:uncharacterized protein B0H18DRAFT_957782 [Neoantrodia serialis]KAH9918782.1 hypothetical protein B0H18DRAFT_957782 [Neoantrodia serialis]
MFTSLLIGGTAKAFPDPLRATPLKCLRKHDNNNSGLQSMQHEQIPAQAGGTAAPASESDRVPTDEARDIPDPVAEGVSVPGQLSKEEMAGNSVDVEPEDTSVVPNADQRADPQSAEEPPEGGPPVQAAANGGPSGQAGEPGQDQPVHQPPVGDAMPSSYIPAVDTALKFIHKLWLNPCLADERLDADNISQLQNPITESPDLSPDKQLSIKLYLADTDGSEKIYDGIHDVILERFAECDVLSHHLVKKKVAELSGVVVILEDMCINSCLAYTETCPYCSEPCYDPALLASTGKKKARQQFSTFPIGPQIQMGKLDIIEDIPYGSDFWDAYQCGDIKPDDVCLIFSMDGAQLYEHKASNCWIYIWILVDVFPDLRFKKKQLFQGAIVPGPLKPKNSDLKPGGSHYYSVCAKPDNYDESGCDHPDYDPSDVLEASPIDYEHNVLCVQASFSATDYRVQRLDTGISKPSDIMHLTGLNITGLMQKLLRGTINCDAGNSDNKVSWGWHHEKQVAVVRVYLPGSFDRPPRNPAEKISSGYKCWEFLHWMYGLGPALLHGIMPTEYWENFCKLVAGVRIILQ